MSSQIVADLIRLIVFHFTVAGWLAGDHVPLCLLRFGSTLAQDFRELWLMGTSLSKQSQDETNVKYVCSID